VRRDISTSGLTERQAAFCSSLIRGAKIQEAALAAGYSHGESGYQALASSAVQAALHDYRDRTLKTEGATLAMQTMMDLCDAKVPAGVRFSAAKWIMEAAGHVAGQPGAGGDEVPVHQMTLDQLRRHADGLRQQIDRQEAELPRIEGQASVSAQPGHIDAQGSEEEA
jgi:hypothetical protein